MSLTQESSSSAKASEMPLGMFAHAMEYMVDAAQRNVLFWDVMRQRGNQYFEHMAETVPTCSTMKSNWFSTDVLSTDR